MPLCLLTLLSHMACGTTTLLYEGGKTSGSACKFKHKNGECIFIHKPHPKLILKSYQMNLIIKYLKEMNLI